MYFSYKSQSSLHDNSAKGGLQKSPIQGKGPIPKSSEPTHKKAQIVTSEYDFYSNDDDRNLPKFEIRQAKPRKSDDVNQNRHPKQIITTDESSELKPIRKKRQMSKKQAENVGNTMKIMESPQKLTYWDKKKDMIKKQRKFTNNLVLYNYQSDWGFNGKEKYIEILPTKKMDLKKDRRVVFPGLVLPKPGRDRENQADFPSGIPGMPRELIKANDRLKLLPLHWNTTLYEGTDMSLEDVMLTLQRHPACYRKPIFLTMATVGDDLYWQLIENFVYSMLKFNMVDCAIVICVSDAKCMKMCHKANFPCFHYRTEQGFPKVSVMEQIAKVKLYHVPKALEKGVDVFMLDLDVGFLSDPAVMVRAFVETPIVDVMVQEDYIFVMNRTKAGWKSWFTEPLPNIGLFLCRGNNRTAKVFDIAWQKYLLMDDPIEKSQPGKDQNHVLEAMRIGRGTFGLKYAYFSNYTAPLMDKMIMNYGIGMELGGEAIQSFLLQSNAIAVHTTCYEKSTKVMGLKAANAFWNPRYYDPLRRTITKQLLYINDLQLLDDVRSLIWLAMTTKRALIVPNILGPSNIGDSNMKLTGFNGMKLWPGFRVVYLKRNNGQNDLKVDILEPGYYWRVSRDYDDTPDPNIIFFDPEKENLDQIKEKVLGTGETRVILHYLRHNRVRVPSTEIGEEEERIRKKRIADEVKSWADDSIGLFAKTYESIMMNRDYMVLPSVKDIRHIESGGSKYIQEVLQGMRTCYGIFDPPQGNRTCFQICK
jgi:hypothetical protein